MICIVVELYGLGVFPASDPITSNAQMTPPSGVRRGGEASYVERNAQDRLAKVPKLQLVGERKSERSDSLRLS